MWVLFYFFHYHNMTGISDLRDHLDTTLLSKGEVDFLWANHEWFPPELQFLRDNVRSQVDHITQNIFALLVLNCADTLLYSTEHTIILFQDQKWDLRLIRWILFRLWSVFVEGYFIWESWIWSTLLEYMKEHKRILLRENIALENTDNGTLRVHKFTESQPEEISNKLLIWWSPAEVINLFAYPSR